MGEPNIVTSHFMKGEYITMKRSKLVSLILSTAMLLSLVTVPAAAAEEDVPVTTSLEETTPVAAAPTPIDFPDMKDHWGAKAVDRWSGVGVLRGDQFGNFRPDDRMTRGEFATMLVNLMGYTVKAENIYADVSADAWYADAILKVTAAGVMQGDGTNANPESPITRQEAAVMLCRALNLKPTDKATTSFVDAGDIADWAKGAVAALASRGMVQGMGNNDFLPTHDINRASVAQMVSNMVSSYVTEDGATVTGEQKGLVIVAADDVKIEDATLAEALIVAPKAVDATVTLAGETKAADVVVAAEGAKVVVEKDASAASIALDAPKTSAEVAGKADLIAANADDVAVTVDKDAEVKDVNVNGEGADVTVAGKVDNVTVADTAKDTDITVEQGATVDKVDNNAEGTSIDGKGKIANLASDKDVELAKDTTVSKIENTGDEAIKVGDKEIKPDSSSSSSSTPSSNGGVGGGSSTSYKYKVSVASATGGKVTADVTQTNTADTEVTLTVTPDPQKGSTMPYVLKNLTVMNGETAVDVTENKFTMAEEGTYTVTAEFVQPITKAVMYVANGTDKTAADMEADGYTPEGDVTDAILKDYPYFFIGMTKNTAEGVGPYTISDFKITANGKNVDLPTGWGTPSSIFKFASAYVSNEKPSIDPHEGADMLNLTGSAYAFVLTFKVDTAEYELTCDYVKPGVTAADLKTVTFKTSTGKVIASYKGTAEETVTAPAHPELDGYYFTGWDKTVTEGEDYTIGEGGEVTANYIQVTNTTLSVRANGPEGNHEPVVENFEYSKVYTAAGLSMKGSKITVDAAKLIAMVNSTDETTAANLAHIKGNGSLANDVVFGVAYKTPTGAKKVAFAGTLGGLSSATNYRELATHPSCYDNTLISYIPVATVNPATKLVTFATEGDSDYCKWVDDDNNIVAVTKTVIEVETTNMPQMTVTFKDGDKTVSTVKVDYNSAEWALADAPVNGNNIFLGWFDGETKVTAAKALTADLTLTAKWQEVIELTVTPYDFSCPDGERQYITYTLKNSDEPFYIAGSTVEKCEFRNNRQADGEWTEDTYVELFTGNINDDNAFEGMDKEHQLGWTVSRRDAKTTAYWRFTGKDGKIYIATFEVPAKIANPTNVVWGDTLISADKPVTAIPVSVPVTPEEGEENPEEGGEENPEEGDQTPEESGEG